MKLEKRLLIFCLLFVFALGTPSCKCQSSRTVIECGGAGDFACPAGMFCDYGSTCGGIDALGKCRYQPTNCPQEDAPVCGCDMKTYGSKCYANASGTTVAYSGPCIKKQ